MAKDERSGGGSETVYEFKDKDNYNFVLTQHLVVLANEAVRDGLSENYVHGVFSFMDKLPSREWQEHKVHKGAIARLNVLRGHIIRKLGLPDNQATDGGVSNGHNGSNGGIKPLKEGMNHLDLFEWALGLDPDFYHLYPKDGEPCRVCGAERISGRKCGTCNLDEKEVMKFHQTIIFEIIAVDLSDDMESLRSRIPKSEQGWSGPEEL